MKGLVVEKKFGSYIILTSSGEYRRIYGTTKADIGQDVSLDNKPSMTWTASLAASILIIFLLSDVIFGVVMNTRVYAYVTLDINPSAEFAINSEHDVLNAYAYNQEAKDILTGMNYSGENIETVLADFTLAAINNHYIEDGKQNRVIVSFYPRQSLEEVTIESELDKITDEQRKVIDLSGKQVEMNTVVIDEETRQEAKKQGITPGKLKENKNQLNKDNDSPKDSEKKADKEAQKEAEKALKEAQKENKKEQIQNKKENKKEQIEEKKENKKQEKLQQKHNKDIKKLNKDVEKLNKIHERLEKRMQKQTEKQQKDEQKLNQKKVKSQKDKYKN